MLAARLGPVQAVPPFMARYYEGDCGLDLITSEAASVCPGGTADIPCGVAVALPPATFGWITGRSSTWTRWGLQVMGGIIDEGWRGELFTLVYKPILGCIPHESGTSEGCPGCFGNEPVTVPAGTRLAQLIILPNLASQVELYRVHPDDLPASDRGTSGFGSTG